MSSKKIVSNKQQQVKVASRLRNLKNLIRIVGIGTSAGGLEALESLFKNAPPLSGTAFVVVQHLDIKHKSIISELLQPSTSMPVIQITNQTKIEPDCIYIIPPNHNLTIKKSILYLSPLTSAEHSLNKTIDYFFHSLANDQRERAVGIILSGLGNDGVEGLTSIKEKNGLTLAQDPLEAKFNAMPCNAIDAKVIDIIAPTTKLLGKLTNLMDPVTHKISIDKKIKYSEQNLAAITHIIKLIHKKTGYDFLQYKIGTIYRRIERRITVHRIDTILGYLDYIQENPNELELLMKELLIGVTSFFRDLETWNSLESEILPTLLAGFKKDNTIRVWIPGCSTGEEVYTLAIVLQEAINKFKTSNHYIIQIFATDISLEAIEVGRKGVYAHNLIKDVPQEYLTRYFKKLDTSGNGYQVNENIRKMVIFAQHNLVSNAPFTRLDIISCRNLFIYFNSELQQRLIGLFHYALNPTGILILGTSESIGNSTSLFSLINSKLRIYKYIENSINKMQVEFPILTSVPVMTNSSRYPKTIKSIEDTVKTLLMEKYVPPAVVINDTGDILCISGRTGRYLEPAAGKIDWNLYSMAREGIAELLPASVSKLLTQQAPLTLKGLQVVVDNNKWSVDIVLQKIKEEVLFTQSELKQSTRTLILVVFIDTTLSDHNTLMKATKKKSGNQDIVEQEFQNLRDEMHAMNGAWQGANEQLQSSNEELQSSNEELTTSKEELQSLNEEVQTINTELVAKVEKLVWANTDMNNLLNSAEIAAIFLDKSLYVRRFTSQVTKVFKLRSSDEGRALSDISNDLKYPALLNDIKGVIESHLSIDKLVVTNDKRYYKVRIMPYTNYNNKVDGVVITLLDISFAKALKIKK